jgi:hypothetical protein
MSDNQSSRVRVKQELTNSLAVSGVSALLAAAALFAFSRIGDSTSGGLLLALNIAVFIPYAYDQFWPEEYSRTAAVVWTTSAALITAGVFVGVYQLLLAAASTEYTVAIAFVVTVVVQYSAAASFVRAR